jgi:hypothetical protein
MTRKLGVGVLAAALLMSGALVGVSFGGGGGITQPEVIELSLSICGRPNCTGWELRHAEWGRGGGLITVARDPLFDADGTRVGSHRMQCVVGDWQCNVVIELKAGPYTELGTVVTSGMFRWESSTFAVTGGTGAYENVRGSATLEDPRGPDNAVLTLNLIP